MFTHKLTDDAELRLLEPRHAQELYAVLNRNRERLRMMPFIDHVTSVEAEREFAKRSLHQFADGLGFECGIWFRGNLSGGIGMFPINERDHSTMLGYWLDEEAEGKGIVTISCREIIDHLFYTLDVNRIVIRTIPANLRSKAVANRLGFTYEGTSRQSEMLRGEYVDVEIYSLLRKDLGDKESNVSPFFSWNIGEHAELRLLEPRHAQELYLLVDSNREYLRRWLPWVDSTKSTDDIVAFIKQQLQKFATNGTTVASIWYEKHLAGIIALNSSSVRCMEIGYWLGEEYQGKGLMTAACKAMIGYSFVELDINRIEIRVEPDNDRSKAVPGRLGFTYEGTQRQKGMNADGKAVDLMMFSLLKEEWEAPSHVC